MKIHLVTVNAEGIELEFKKEYIEIFGEILPYIEMFRQQSKKDIFYYDNYKIRVIFSALEYAEGCTRVKIKDCMNLFKEKTFFDGRYTGIQFQLTHEPD